MSIEGLQHLHQVREVFGPLCFQVFQERADADAFARLEVLQVAVNFHEQDVSIADLAQQVGQLLDASEVFPGSLSRETGPERLHSCAETSGGYAHIMNRFYVSIGQHLIPKAPHVVEEGPDDLDCCVQGCIYGFETAYLRLLRHEALPPSLPVRDPGKHAVQSFSAGTITFDRNFTSIDGGSERISARDEPDITVCIERQRCIGIVVASRFD